MFCVAFGYIPFSPCLSAVSRTCKTDFRSWKYTYQLQEIDEVQMEYFLKKARKLKYLLLTSLTSHSNINYLILEHGALVEDLVILYTR